MNSSSDAAYAVAESEDGLMLAQVVRQFSAPGLSEIILFLVLH